MINANVVSHTYEKTVTERAAYGVDTFQPTSHQTSTTEELRVTLSVSDAEPFVRSKRTGQVVRPRLLRVPLISRNGEPWHVVDWKVRLIGNNVLKSGKLGAEVEIELDLPKQIKELFTKDGDDRSLVHDWARAEYPR